MYHGAYPSSEMIAVGFAILVWIIRGIARGLKKLSRPTAPPVPPQAPLPPQNPFHAQNALGTQMPPQDPFRAMAPYQAQDPFGTQASSQPGQAPPRPPLSVQGPAQAGRPASAVRYRPRQPSAGGPAVPAETNRQDFVRQEQELFASEPAGLGTPLTSPAPPAAAPNALFGGTDDLIRAIILQEVLGPPLSRRQSPPPPST